MSLYPFSVERGTSPRMWDKHLVVPFTLRVNPPTCIVCPREFEKSQCKPWLVLCPSTLHEVKSLTMPIVSYAYRLLMRIQRSLLLCFSALLHRKKDLIHLRFSFTRSSRCSFCVLPSLLLSHLQRKSVNVKTTR